MAGELQLAKGLKTTTNVPADSWRGPYTTVTNACTAIPTVMRLYRTVDIITESGLVEYWWKNGTADNDLVEKSTAGLQGEKGDQGERGERGADGAQGDKGDTGDIGPVGDQGEQGETGATGAQGEKGDKGDQGDNANLGGWYIENGNDLINDNAGLISTRHWRIEPSGLTFGLEQDAVTPSIGAVYLSGDFFIYGYSAGFNDGYPNDLFKIEIPGDYAMATFRHRYNASKTIIGSNSISVEWANADLPTSFKQVLSLNNTTDEVQDILSYKCHTINENTQLVTIDNQFTIDSNGMFYIGNEIKFTTTTNGFYFDKNGIANYLRFPLSGDCTSFELPVINQYNNATIITNRNI